MSTSVDLLAILDTKLREDTVRVPPYSAVASKLQRLVTEERFGMQEVTSVVAADPALATVLLRRANSAENAGSLPATTLGTAIFRLGIDAVIRLALAATVGGIAGVSGPLAALRRDQWRCSLLSALLCHELAGRRRLLADQAFVAGLLHDIGAIVVVAALEDLVKEHRLPVLPAAAWRRAAEQYHVAVGAAVAKSWQLPDTITQVIVHHHKPGARTAAYGPLLQLVTLVDEIIATLDRDPGGGLAALDPISDLAPDERSTMAALLQQCYTLMSSFDECLPPVIVAAAAASSVTVEPLPSGMSPIDLPVEIRGTTASYRATAISSMAIAFRGKVPLRTGCLMTLTLKCEPSIMVMVTINACEGRAESGYLIVAQPFGLATGDRAVWVALATGRSAA